MHGPPVEHHSGREKDGLQNMKALTRAVVDGDGAGASRIGAASSLKSWGRVLRARQTAKRMSD